MAWAFSVTFAAATYGWFLHGPHARVASASEPAATFSGKAAPDIVAVVMAAQLTACTGYVDSARVAEGLKRLERILNDDASRMADDRQTFVLSFGLMAIVGAKDFGRYDRLIERTRDRLKAVQWDATGGNAESKSFLGGAGYKSLAPPDLYHTSLAIESLRRAGVPASDPFMQRAIRFVSSCQCLENEGSPAASFGATERGGFSIAPPAPNGSKGKREADDSLPPCGSLTCAGLKSLIYCGVPKEDRRVVAALDWVRRNYTLAANPGMSIPRFRLYDYYLSLSGAMTVFHEDSIVDAKNVRHNWRRELEQVLEAEQQPDGSWLNPAEADTLAEAHPLVTTSLAVMTLRRITGNAKRPANQYMAAALRWE